MRSDRVIRPGRRKETASSRPSHAGSAFPISDYVIPPSDARGRSASITTSVPPAMQRLASILVERKVFPFESHSDVFRWCIHHGLLKLAGMAEDTDVTSEVATIQNWIRTEAVQLEHLYYDAHLTQIIATIGKLADAGHTVKAIALADLVWRQNDRISDPYWCEMYRARMKKVLDRLRDREERRVRDKDRRREEESD